MVDTVQIVRLLSLAPGILPCVSFVVKSSTSPVPKGTSVIDTLTQVCLCL